MSLTLWQIVASAAAILIPTVVGLLVYVRIPKKDMGASALATVQAADKAIFMLEEQYVKRLETLEETVADLVNERNGLYEAKLSLEVEIERLTLWVRVLAEQVTKLGGVPITLERLEEDETLRET